MSVDCRITAELSGINPDVNAVVERIQAHGRASRECSRVRVTIRPSPTAPALASAEVDVAFLDPVSPDPADPSNDGTWAVEFPLSGLPIVCGLRLWVEAECVLGGTCSTSGMREIACKSIPGSGGGQPGDGDGGGSTGWPWPFPPIVMCPLFGRSFAALLVAGLTMFVVGVAFANQVMAGGGIALIAVAFGTYALWNAFCVPIECYVYGVILWALKRAVIAGAVASIMMMSVPGVLATMGLGALAGSLTAFLRRRRCSLPAWSDPLSSLPLW